MDARISSVEAAEFLDITVQAIHHTLKTKSLTHKKSDRKVYFGHETAREIFKINFDKKIIAFHNLKGGVGKTELTHCCAVKASLYGARVLCIDLDMQGNLTEDCFRTNADEIPVMIDILKDNLPLNRAIIKIAPGLDLIGSRLENGVLDNYLQIERYPLDRVYRSIFEKLMENYDFCFIDLPPAFTPSTAAAVLGADEVVIPITPDRRSIRGLQLCHDEIMNLIEKYKKNVSFKVVLNEYDIRNTLSNNALEFLVKDEQFGQFRYKTHIRRSQDFPNAVGTGDSIFKTLRRTNAKEDIDLFTRELLNINNKNRFTNKTTSGEVLTTV